MFEKPNRGSFTCTFTYILGELCLGWRGLDLEVRVGAQDEAVEEGVGTGDDAHTHDHQVGLGGVAALTVQHAEVDGAAAGSGESGVRAHVPRPNDADKTLSGWWCCVCVGGAKQRLRRSRQGGKPTAARGAGAAKARGQGRGEELTTAGTPCGPCSRT